jgi:hypothetical protein
LSPTIYSTLLLKCDLVEIRTSRDGSKSVRLAREKWIGFINQYHGLQGDAEYTDGGIKRGAIFDDLDDAAAAGYIPKFPLLRIGKVRLGKSPPSNTAINRGDEPPHSTIKPVLGLTWLIVVSDLSWDRQQSDRAQKREPATHESR